jgi:hypothetical protein
VRPLGHIPTPYDLLLTLTFDSGGWESIDYPKGTGENLPSYPAPPGGWGSVDYSKGGAAAPAKCPEAPKMAGSPFTFTSYYEVKATPDQVVNGTTPTGGLAGASGLFKIGINSELNLICYNIEIYGFRGEYQSPAATATHIHEAAKGASGPPRIAFPNPVDVGNGVRRSVGCQQGPFKTGLLANGKDTATSARLKSTPKASLPILTRAWPSLVPFVDSSLRYLVHS